MTLTEENLTETKVAVITDTHFGARNDSVNFLDFYEKFYKETFFPNLEKLGIKIVLMLGDTFDRRKYVNFYSLKRTKEMFFDELAKRDIKVFMLAGNHDTYFKNTNDVNSVDLLLREYGNVRVVNSPEEIQIGSHKICMMPWICAENYQESMDMLANTDASYCMGHFEIEGFAMYRGLPSTEGLKRELFRKFSLTLSGHYHHKSSHGDIHYLGNPYELTWQDYNDDRGFHILDLDSELLTFIKNPNVMFHKITYDDKTESITEINGKDMTPYNQAYVKVVVVNKTNPYLFDKFMANLYEVNPLDVTIAEDFTDLTEGVDDDMIDQAEDTLTIIKNYINGISEEDLDTTRLNTIITELYVEALNTEQA
jgi:DNA repair exonuclease SbcCD nuclease subunit